MDLRPLSCSHSVAVSTAAPVCNVHNVCMCACTAYSTVGGVIFGIFAGGGDTGDSSAGLNFDSLTTVSTMCDTDAAVVSTTFMVVCNCKLMKLCWCGSAAVISVRARACRCILLGRLWLPPAAAARASILIIITFSAAAPSEHSIWRLVLRLVHAYSDALESIIFMIL